MPLHTEWRYMYQVDLVPEFGQMDLIISNNVNVSSLAQYVLKSTVFITLVTSANMLNIGLSS